MTSSNWIGGTAVFRQRGGNSDSEATVPIAAPITQRFLLAFDNANGLATGMAVLNPDSVQTTTASVEIRDDSGRVINKRSLSLPPRTRGAFMLPAQFPETAGGRGVAEFSYQPAGLGAFGLRFTNQLAFTSFQAIATQSQLSEAVTLAIPQIADGANWKTTFVLVNRGGTPAPFSMVFRKARWKPAGSASVGVGTFTEYSDTVPARGMRIIETPGTSS